MLKKMAYHGLLIIYNIADTPVTRLRLLTNISDNIAVRFAPVTYNIVRPYGFHPTRLRSSLMYPTISPYTGIRKNQ